MRAELKSKLEALRASWGFIKFNQVDSFIKKLFFIIEEIEKDNIKYAGMCGSSSYEIIQLKKEIEELKKEKKID